MNAQSAHSCLKFLGFNHLPRCEVWVEKMFGDYAALNYAHEGEIEWCEDGKVFRSLKGPVVWWTLPRRYYAYGVRNGTKGWDHRYVTISGEWLPSLLRSSWWPSEDLPGYRRIRHGERFLHQFDLLLESLGHGESLVASAHFLELLNLLMIEQVSVVDSKSDRRVQELLTAIRRSPEKPWLEKDSACFCGISPAQMRRLIRKRVGMSLRQFHLKERVRLAASLLREGDLPLKQIADRCGIHSVEYFSRVFLQEMSVRPGKYRRQMCLEEEES